MQPCTNLLKMILVAWFTFGLFVTTSFADTPLPFEIGLLLTDPRSLIYLIIACFVATLVVEYPVVYWMLRRPKKARLQLFLWMIFINAITNPGVQIALSYLEAAVLGREKFGWLYLGLIELVVALVEFGLFRWIFSRMYRGNALREPVTTIRTLVTAVVANLASFLIGGIGVRAVFQLAYRGPTLQ